MGDGETSDQLIADTVPVVAAQTDTTDEASPDIDPPTDLEKTQVFSNPNARAVQEIIHSDIGVSTLLNRLKQSIASAKEFAVFLKKRSILEEEHSNGLRKLCRITAESIKKPDYRHGSFLSAFEEITTIHEKMAENGAKFSHSLYQMHDDLLEMATNVERGRKHWKITGISAEQRAADAEAAMKKSKSKYDTLAEDYDRVRTGDRQSGKLFGLKGPKSAAQHEEDMLRKLYAADADYATKVQAAQSLRADLWSKSRPDTVKALEELIRECDSALTLQMQKFASFNEKLLLSNGLNVHPIKEFDVANQTRSLRDAIYSIDNDKDFNDYLMSFANKISPRISEIKYQRNSILTRTGQRYSDYSTSNPKQGNSQVSYHGPGKSKAWQHERNLNQSVPLPTYGTVAQQKASVADQNANFKTQSISLSYNKQSPTNISPQSQYSDKYYNLANTENLLPIKPVFGINLEELYERDGSAVPMVVRQCIQAVDLFGLEVEGIYRLSGTASQVNKIKSLFDNDATLVDFRDPANFFHDVNSVAGLLKQFFRDLPDPLLTSEHYTSFIEAAKNEDEILCRDSLHAIINSLSDPNYATLRAVTLHLHRVQDNSKINRMNISNLAIVFGPTLMGVNTGSNIQNAGWQVKVIETILSNCYQIFDDD
ncbi:RHO GTPase-activating protein RGD1 [Erysiphe neolycopersici]|uniref:RHO GTPase-activating protein RGD1 n=1 Tax=Erysiphe neolycopersici TaxID=212602 RepID=A0A420HKJ6_9PEZI|nr:RHO GTPase-activating protein RGD1 [Erysiphe neolycopersici]